jgi:hypothetical protein
MMQDKPINSYCSRCGGDRRHVAQKTLDRRWDNEELSIWGHDTWQILECNGCQNVTFVHTHWFSEDIDDRGQPIVHRDLYPPAPRRAKPEWARELWHALPRGEHWLNKLYDDIYGALGMRAFGLATMGMRAIVDFVVTSKAGDDIRGFKSKLNAMCEQGVISELQVEILNAAFDAGSAAAHRGYSPSRDDANSLLDITESLLRRLYVDPMHERQHARAAADLTKRTPKRSKPK